MERYIKGIVIGLLLLAFTSYKTEEVPNEVTLEELEQCYKAYYLTSEMDSMPWNGSLAGCKPGTMPGDVLKKAENRVNFFRLVNRLPLITMDADSTVFPQAAALMMLSNNSLSHKPSTNWKCYSKAGARGAMNSCLGFSDYENFPEDAFITGFVDDWGEENAMVGHRRWLLYSQIKRFSYGATSGSEALYCFMNDPHEQPSALPYIAYPWSGYVPYNLVFSKWSFAIPEGHTVSFTKTKVEVRDQSGKGLKIRMYPYEKFLDHTLVWYMEDMYTPEEEEYGENNLNEKGFVGQTYTVQVSDVLVDGVMRSYTYQVKIVDLDNLKP